MQAEQEFLALVERNRDILHKISRMYADDPESRRDLVQEILYQLWRSFPNFKAESSFSTWMYRVALNTAITFFKKQKRNHQAEDLHQRGNINEAADTSNQIEWFYRAVQTLSKIDRAIILLYLEDYSHKEIGQQLGISEGNARVRFNRAKNKLKELSKYKTHES